jgi:hypothetical protein
MLDRSIGDGECDTRGAINRYQKGQSQSESKPATNSARVSNNEVKSIAQQRRGSNVRWVLTSGSFAKTGDEADGGGLTDRRKAREMKKFPRSHNREDKQYSEV